MSHLTPEIEEALFWLKEMCSDANKGDPDIGPLTIRDKIVELEELIENALTPKCEGCGEPMDSGDIALFGNACADCYKNQQQKAMITCYICKLLFVPTEPGQAICRACLDDEARAELHHREEMQRAHAATNGTL